jgi:hypothetical protein
MRKLTAFFAVAAMTATLAAPANADYHLTKIKQVHPGSAAAPLNEFIVLQFYADGQNLLAGHNLSLWDADGFQVNSFALSNVPNGGSQRTVLIANTGATVDEDISFGPANNYFDPGGGSVCFDSVDCVSWGPDAPLPPGPSSPIGAQAPALPDGMSLTRSISRGCATLLEAGDDTDDSAADFFAAPPNPRNNASAPTEVACTPSSTTQTTALPPPGPTGRRSAALKKCKKKKGRAKSKCKKKANKLPV